MKNLIKIFIVLLLLSPRSFGTIINVPEDYTTIPEAINASVDGDTVMVGPGNYQDDIRFMGKGILLTSRFGPDSTQIGTVRIVDGEDSTTILRGFYVRSSVWGTPVISQNVNNPIIEGNEISSNITIGSQSAGIRAENRTIIRHNIVSDNYSYVYCAQGGGVRISGDCTLSENIISGNGARGDGYPVSGGGVYLNGGVCIYNLIVNNHAIYLHDQGSGGGIQSDNRA